MYQEDERTELKKSTSELKEAIISIVAILNKHGKGKIYFGIKDRGEVIGQQVTNETIRNVSKQISENIEPRIYPTVSKIELEKRDCILVEFEGEDIPYFAFGRTYMRVGDEDRQLTQKEIKKIILKVEEKNNKWEEKPSAITLENIDEETIKEFIKKGNEKGRINFKYTNKEDVLKKLNLIDNNGKIKNAGYVLFGKEINIELRGAIFATDTKTTFLDMKDFKGNIFNLIDYGEQYIAQNIRWSLNFNTGKFDREDIPEAPIRAMREILCNSFCHRDWNEPYDNYLAIYKNRIEICNPGFFTEEATPEDYINKEEPSRPRNPLIAQVLYLSGEIEKLGAGIRNVYKICQEDKIKVEFENRKTAFFTVVYRKDVEGLIENAEKNLKANTSTKMLNYIIEKVKPYLQQSYLKRYFDWFIKKLDLQDKAEKLDKMKNKGKHPIQPRRGDIYLIEFGENIGKELSNTHMGIIVQNSSNNIASHTTIVVPISSSQRLYIAHERILEKDIKEGKLNILPSKAKADQITCIDKARMLYKIGSVTDEFMSRLDKRIAKNLDIKIE